MAHAKERHKTNPFVKDMVIPVGGKDVRISTLGRDNNILVNQTTGEVAGTHVVARKRVDKEKFVKTFADYMSFTFDLTKAGNKALRVVMWALKEQAIAKDVVVLDKFTHEDFLEHYGFGMDDSPSSKKKNDKPALSYPTFTRGLAELEKAKIIAKSMRVGHYFINPQCMFNGDRVAFSTVIEVAREDQQELPLE